ncbi:MAG: NAD-dependent epimerase/dehydratase family protein [Firmicutes bacterium]|nr:NAD-dependent epimerase/dehydratase family protein [Bacillota bacterium]
MKILITGERGYIARRLREALGARHECASVSLRGPELPDMVGYDCVIHCAGIVHRNRVSADEYMDVNWELTANLAEKARTDRVSRFVFMSTMAVYGRDGSKPPARCVITPASVPRPRTMYGVSKLAAEKFLKDMASTAGKPEAAPDGQRQPRWVPASFSVSVLRLPMVYGEGCPGNFAKLRRAAQILPVFPNVPNERSVLNIANLCEFVELLLKEPAPPGGFAIYCPQDGEYARTTEIVRLLAQKSGKNIILSEILGKIACFFPLGILRKLFGNLVYAQEMSAYFDRAYCVKSLEETIGES